MPDGILKQFVLDADNVSPNAVYNFGREVKDILKSYNYIGNHGWKRNPNKIKRHKDNPQEVFESPEIRLFAHTTWTEGQVRKYRVFFTDRNSRDGYLCPTREMSKMTPELTLSSSPNYHINGRLLSLDRINGYRLPLHGLQRLKTPDCDTPATSSLP
ncbi:hypothetical protein TNCV_4560391 [Trichonephila clavipes]|nr:hypothetical protein TNCV_4560391 [Trichonephila clavipes]